MANQGIMHLSSSQGGRPFCRTRRSIMSTTPALAKDWPRICAKCARSIKPKIASGIGDDEGFVVGLNCGPD